MISSLSLSAISHATEDPEKVKTAILNLAPKQVRSSIKVNLSSAKGHHGNPITLFSADIDDPESTKKIINHVVRSLSEAELSHIRDQFSFYYDGHSSIFLRFDKQSAYLGSLRLSTSDDVVKLRINLLKGEIKSAMNLFSPSP